MRHNYQEFLSIYTYDMKYMDFTFLAMESVLGPM